MCFCFFLFFSLFLEPSAFPYNPQVLVIGGLDLDLNPWFLQTVNGKHLDMSRCEPFDQNQGPWILFVDVPPSELDSPPLLIMLGWTKYGPESEQLFASARFGLS